MLVRVISVVVFGDSPVSVNVLALTSAILPRTSVPSAVLTVTSVPTGIFSIASARAQAVASSTYIAHFAMPAVRLNLLILITHAYRATCVPAFFAPKPRQVCSRGHWDG